MEEPGAAACQASSELFGRVIPNICGHSWYIVERHRIRCDSWMWTVCRIYFLTCSSLERKCSDRKLIELEIFVGNFPFGISWAQKVLFTKYNWWEENSIDFHRIHKKIYLINIGARKGFLRSLTNNFLPKKLDWKHVVFYKTTALTTLIKFG